VLESLVQAIRSRQAILFVGAGVSMNLGLPSWNSLIDHIAGLSGYDPSVFRQHGDHLSLAEYYHIQQGTLGRLRSWMDRTWHENEARVDSSAIHQLIVDLDFSIIYTTNYDRWLEIALARRGKNVVKISSVGDIAGIRDHSTQVVKFHGDFESDESLVLTETSYFERMSFESPLDIKLRSDSLGRPILFIGYGLSDFNIRYLFYKLHRLWETSIFRQSRPKSYIYLSRPNPVQEAILERRGITAIVSENDNPGIGLEDLLKKLLREVRGV
jgi:hypothetical protein